MIVILLFKNHKALISVFKTQCMHMLIVTLLFSKSAIIILYLLMFCYKKRTTEKKKNFVRIINLDTCSSIFPLRRKLTVCPMLEGEDQLRLLNYQHNSITRIQHLSALRRLIFLDLYDNQIEQITGLNSLRSLRVLMLGKNR